MNPSYLILGSVTVAADYGNVTALLNMCMHLAIPYSDFKSYPNRVTVTFRLSEFKRFQREANTREICYTVEKRRGLPIFLYKYKYRFGLWIGILCAVALVLFSHLFIWDIEVTGNEKVTSGEIREMLREQGFSVGSFIPRANTDKIENRILMESEKISWISVNIIGTVANVEVREREAERPPEPTRPANLVAKKSGVVEEVRIFRGNVLVGAGKYVNQGEILVSGLFDSVQEGFRYTRASGKVSARTVEEFYIEIPYEYEMKRYTGEEYCEKILNFFDFSMNISKNSGNEGILCDKINIVENCNLFGRVQTPFSVETVRYLEYETVYETRSAEAAEELAYFELDKKLSEMSEDSILIKKTVTPLVRDDRFILHCTIVLIEDIAEVSEFDVILGE